MYLWHLACRLVLTPPRNWLWLYQGLNSYSSFTPTDFYDVFSPPCLHSSSYASYTVRLPHRPAHRRDSSTQQALGLGANTVSRLSCPCADSFSLILYSFRIQGA